MKAVKKFRVNQRIYGKSAGYILVLRCSVNGSEIVIDDNKWQRIWKDSKIDNTLSLIPDEIKAMQEKIEHVKEDVKIENVEKKPASKKKLKK